MHEPVCVRADLHECAEVHKPYDGTLEAFTRHVFTRKVNDLLECSFCRAIPAGDEDCAVLFDSDVIALGTLSDAVDGFAPGSDNETYMVHFHLRGEYLWSTRRYIGSRR